MSNNNRDIPNPLYTNAPYCVSYWFVPRLSGNRKRDRHWIRQQTKNFAIDLSTIVWHSETKAKES